MNESYLDRLKKKRQEQALEKKRQAELKKTNDTVSDGTKAIQHELARQSAKSRTSTQQVKVENENLAEKEDVASVVEAVNRLNLTTFIASKDSWGDVVENLSELAAKMRAVVSELDDNGNSLTVDAPVGTPVFVRLSDGSAAISTLPVSLASVPSHAVTNAGTFAVQVDAALPAGTNAIGKLAANSGVDIGDVDVASIAAGTNTIGNVGVIPRTSGGMTIFRSIDIDETEEEIKGTAGQVFSISAFNRTAAPLYLKFYNATAANVTVGTTTPVLTFVVPANADSDGSGFIWNNDIGFAFGTAITVACTTGVADNDTGAPGANDCVINIGYA